jgi:hypothetical protein
VNYEWVVQGLSSWIANAFHCLPWILALEEFWRHWKEKNLKNSIGPAFPISAGDGLKVVGYQDQNDGTDFLNNVER